MSFVSECWLCKKPGIKSEMYGVKACTEDFSIIEDELRYVHEKCIKKLKRTGNIFNGKN